MAKLKLSLGDVISIPLANNLFGFGQIVSPYDRKSGGFLIAIFDFKSSALNGVHLPNICNSEIIFLGFTFDAKLYHKHWSVIGNYTKNISTIKTPYNKLGTPPDEIYLIDADNNILAEISEHEFHDLEYRTEIAPVRFENALKAHFGLQEWKGQDFDKILYNQTLKSNEVAAKVLSNALG